ncbi:hypothetical protein MMC20_001999 [Loxospora ochrophaea]|nr:hypothetical protein [Loxospora ochrophaea]
MGGDHAISEDGSLSSEARLALPLSTTSSSQASSRDSSRPTSPELPPSPSPSRAADRLSVEVALSSLKLTPDDPERMFRSLARIIETAEEREESIDFDRLDVDDLGEVLRNADLSERRGYKDVDALRIIRSVLDQMWSNESQLIVEVAKTLADASKDRKFGRRKISF